MEDTSSDGLGGVKMFDGLTAWFSSSVSKDRKMSWSKLFDQLRAISIVFYSIIGVLMHISN